MKTKENKEVRIPELKGFELSNETSGTLKVHSIWCDKNDGEWIVKFVVDSDKPINLKISIENAD